MSSSSENNVIDLTGVQHHPAIEEIATVLANKTQNADLGFFRTEVAYFLAKMASSMRAMVVTKDRGEIPVNLYAMLLATSGFGKGHSIGIMEEDFLAGFRRRFMENTFPQLAEQSLWELANGRAARNGTDQQEEYDKAERHYSKTGAFPFTFDSGTIPAVKQLRDKLLLGGAGSINFQVDEIGLNLINSTEVLTVFLELFDQGKTKIKLTKNGVDNERGEDLEGKTPANMLLFGTPSKLFDGGGVEDQFWAFMDTGYARRCLFGHGEQKDRLNSSLSPEETYLKLIQPSNDVAAQKWSNHFHSLADPVRFNWRMEVDDEVGIQLMTYKIECEREAEKLPQFDEIRKAEMSHRYFKALKIAGALAFVDESSEIEMEHLMSAILLVEESGQSFQRILSREKSYVRLARYIAEVGSEVTQSDLVETLPFYSGSNARRNDLMTLATAWGHKNHIIIKKTFVDGIEFYKGETLKETNLEEMCISYSDSWAYNYLNEKVPFSELSTLTGAADMHWCNHHFRNGHRLDDNVIPGFNTVVVDCDGDVSLDTVHELLKDYTFLTHTTKRHGENGEDRFRLILPINYYLELDQEEYKEFMNAVLAWLPFKSDEGANQRARKWMTCEGSTHKYNEGKLLDALDFIPKTRRNEDYRKNYQALENLDNLERWFAQRIANGSRNTQMIKYALALVDAGMNLVEVQSQVHSFNKKLSDPLSDDEIDGTILQTVAKRFQLAAA
jgi:hypothetical protein